MVSRARDLVVLASLSTLVFASRGQSGERCVKGSSNEECLASVELLQAGIEIEHFAVDEKRIQDQIFAATVSGIEDAVPEYRNRVFQGACLFVYIALPAMLVKLGNMFPVSVVDHAESMPASMPALSSLRYLAILVLWINHEWKGLFSTSYFFAKLSGFVLQFAEERRAENVDTISEFIDKFMKFVRRRVLKLYPMFALHVVVGALAGFRSNCAPVQHLLLVPNWGYSAGRGTCGTGTWFISVIIACYMIFPFLSPLVRKLKPASLALLLVCCVALMVWSCDFQDHNRWSVLYDRKSVVMVFPNFFIGMILARMWVFLSAWGGISVGFTIGSYIAPVALLLVYVTREGSYRGSYGHGSLRVAYELWITCWTCVLLLSFAGSRSTSQCSSANVPVAMLSWGPLVWMAELALPLYMFNNMSCEFVNQVLDTYFDVTMMTKKRNHPEYAVYYLVGQFIFMHLTAWMFWANCAGLAASNPKSTTKQSAAAELGDQIGFAGDELTSSGATKQS